MSDYVAPPSADRSTGVEGAESTALGDRTAEEVVKSWTNC
jgi:hypothetical protein